MDINKFTIKAQEAIQYTFSLAETSKNQAVETGHLFLNRVDELIMFSPLSKLEVQGIVQLQLSDVAQRLRRHGVNISATQKLTEFLTKVGFDPQYGARPVKRAIQREVLNNLSKEIISSN